MTLWGLLIPEGMAYATMAGLPPEAGLYTIMASLVAYAILGTSRQLVVVATSATAALTASTIAALGPADAAEYAAYAVALVLLVGVLFVLAGVLRLGFVAQFLSRPVMEGFIIGLAIFVAVGQLHKLFGTDKGEGDTVRVLWHTISELGQANPWTMAVGASSLAALALLPRLSRRIPAGLVVLVVAILASHALDLSGRHDVEVVGKIPQGLPDFSLALPDAPLIALWTLLPAAAGILLLAYSEALAIAESFATKHDYEINPNQELIAYGAANLGSGALGGLVACGGMSTSAVNDGAGARTQISGLCAAALGVVTVLFLTPLFTDLPEATLGALIIHAVAHIIKPHKLRAVYRLSPTEFYLGLLALVGVLLLDVLQGLLIAMVASLLLVIYRSSRAGIVAIGRLPGSHRDFGALVRHDDAVQEPGVLILRLDAPLYYANAAANRDEIKRLVLASESPLRAVIFDPEVQHELDVTSIDTVMEVFEWIRGRGTAVFVVSTHTELTAIARRAGLIELLGEEHVVTSIEDALERVTR